MSQKKDSKKGIFSIEILKYFNWRGAGLLRIIFEKNGAARQSWGAWRGTVNETWSTSDSKYVSNTLVVKPTIT